MAGRRGSGEGTVFQRPNGTWAGQGTVQVLGGGTKRVTVYADSRAAASAKLQDRLGRDRAGYATPAHPPTIEQYLDYWLTQIVPIKARPRTIELYESNIRNHLKPALGRIKVDQLAPQQVQEMLNDLYARTGSPRTVENVRGILRNALNQAEREDLISRNPARRVTLPKYEREPITPWTAEQTQAFLNHARHHRWHAAFLMLCIYGTRRGETLGLSWAQVDFATRTIHIEQQLQRINGSLRLGPVKTSAGRRALPMPDVIRHELALLATEEAVSSSGESLVFVSSSATWVDPHNFTRTFQVLAAEAGLPRIKLHHLRHSAATLMKNLGVPDKDIQEILGHAHITTTQQIYQHGDDTVKRRALEGLGGLVTAGIAVNIAVHAELSTGLSAADVSVSGMKRLPEQGSNLDRVLGGPAGTRTRDTLLKSPFRSPYANLPTRVGGYGQMGPDVLNQDPIAVRNAVHPPSSDPYRDVLAATSRLLASDIDPELADAAVRLIELLAQRHKSTQQDVA